MQMRRSDPARMSTAGNDLASPDPVAFFDQQRLGVGVHRREAASVRENDGPAIAAQLVGGIDHLAVASRANRRAVGHRQIDALDKALARLIETDDDWRAKRDLLESVPGVGPATSAPRGSRCTSRASLAHSPSETYGGLLTM